MRILQQIFDMWQRRSRGQSLSCTAGPLGTRGSAGAGPRVAGTVLTISVLLSGSQSIGIAQHGVQLHAFDAADVLPVAGSPSHSSIPFATVFENANMLAIGGPSQRPDVAPSAAAQLGSWCLPAVFTSVNRHAASGQMQTVGARIDTDTGHAQHGLQRLRR